QAGEGKRGPALVRPETMRKLHTMVGPWPFTPDTEPGWPSSGRYGLGMGEVIVDWAPEPLLHHLGQNGKNLASIWIEPKRDFAMVLVTNIDTKKANDALYALSADLYRRFAVAKTGGASKGDQRPRAAAPIRPQVK